MKTGLGDASMDIFPFVTDHGYGLVNAKGEVHSVGLDSLDYNLFCEGATGIESNLC